MPAVITVHEATIHSMQVSIQTLRVGTKQVTMGLFRQLPHGKLVTPHMSLAGVPWGSVNYWWDHDGSAANNTIGPQGQFISYGRKLHIVWQFHDRLWRAIVYERIHPCWFPEYWDATKERRQQAAEHWLPHWTALSILPQLFIAV